MVSGLGPARRLGQASRSTHSPICRIAPLSSAIGMKRRRDRAALGMVPAHQRLEADDLAVSMSPAADRRAQLACARWRGADRVRAGGGRAPRRPCGLEEAIGAAAFSLGAIERGVGVVSSVSAIVASSGQIAMPMMQEMTSFSDPSFSGFKASRIFSAILPAAIGLDESLGRERRTRRRQAGHHARIVDNLADAARRAAARVACRMPEQIVDLLEPVEIEAEHRELLTALRVAAIS